MDHQTAKFSGYTVYMYVSHCERAQLEVQYSNSIVYQARYQASHAQPYLHSRPSDFI